MPRPSSTITLCRGSKTSFLIPAFTGGPLLSWRLRQRYGTIVPTQLSGLRRGYPVEHSDPQPICTGRLYQGLAPTAATGTAGAQAGEQHPSPGSKCTNRSYADQGALQCGGEGACSSGATLDAEQKKYALGASTVFFVIQYQRDLAQAQSNEVGALASYAKARVDLDQALGRTLDAYNIRIEEALTGKVSRPADPLPAVQEQ